MLKKHYINLDLALDMTVSPNIFTELEFCNSLTPFVKNKKIWTEPTSWNAVYSEDPPNTNDIRKLEDWWVYITKLTYSAFD